MSLQHAKSVHDRLRLLETSISGSLGEHLVMALAKCGAVDDAFRVSSDLPSRTVISWTAIISAYADSGQGHKTLEIYQCMQDDGVQPSNYTFVSLFKACGIILDLEQGKELHKDARTRGLATDVFVCSALLSMYGKCGAICEAEDTFSEMVHPDTVSWNTLISAYAKQGQAEKALRLYRQMQEEGYSANDLTIVAALKACGQLADNEHPFEIEMEQFKLDSCTIGQGLHADSRRIGYASYQLVGCTLVTMYGKCRAVMEAHGVFLSLSHLGIISWNALLMEYVRWGEGCKGLQLYKKMQEEGTLPNLLTFSIALQACSILVDKQVVWGAKERLTKVRCLEIVQALHADACELGYASDVFVGTPLLTIYGRCGSIAEAEGVFTNLAYQDIVAWTALLSTYVEQGHIEKALQLYASMQGQGVSPNQLTCTMALQACGMAGEKEESRGSLTKVQSIVIGYSLHIDACLRGFTIDVHVGTATVTMYCKCGALMEAENVFHALCTRDTVAFNAMFSAYAELQQGERARQLYREMQKENVALDDVTMLCLLQVCSEMGSLEMSREIHFAIVSAGHSPLFSIAATLVDAYGSCGSMIDAEASLDELFETDLVSWTACLSGHAGQGDTVASIKILAEIVSTSHTPDDVVLNLVSSSCSHAGLVTEGMEFFELVNRDRSMKPNMQLYGTMIDLLARAGDVKRVVCFLMRMPMQPDATIWLSLLGAFHRQGNVELVEWAFHHAVLLRPHEASAYVLMFNAFAGADLQDLEWI